MQEAAIVPFNPVEFTKELPGVAQPLGFFDPLGFCAGDAPEGKIRFYREVELKVLLGVEPAPASAPAMCPKAYFHRQVDSFVEP